MNLYRWMILKNGDLVLPDAHFLVSYLIRGGKYSEDDARAVLIQILNVVAFCHLQGVVHRDLKPEVVMYSFSFCTVVSYVLRILSCVKFVISFSFYNRATSLPYPFCGFCFFPEKVFGLTFLVPIWP